MNNYGLIGNQLSHSFSKTYFEEKFTNEKILDCSYHLFEMDNINLLPQLIQNTTNLKGLNVTLPYKEAVLPYLTDIDSTAQAIGAVNTIKILDRNKTLKGYNTDYYGFKKTLKPFLNLHHQRALIFGTGGAAKTVRYVFNELNIPCLMVARTPQNKNEIAYSEVNDYVVQHHQIIVNATPVGMGLWADKSPLLNAEKITPQHLLYDLIYNPAETLFLKQGKQQGCITINGLQMLQLQAEKAWEIWNKAKF